MGQVKRHQWLAGMIILFALATVFSGGKALFTESGIQQRGHIVPLILIFNFTAGFFYLLTGLLILKLKRWSITLTYGLVLSNLFVLAYLYLHIAMGSPYETKTLFAMHIRTFFWLGIGWCFYSPHCSLKS